MYDGFSGVVGGLGVLHLSLDLSTMPRAGVWVLRLRVLFLSVTADSSGSSASLAFAVSSFGCGDVTADSCGDVRAMSLLEPLSKRPNSLFPYVLLNIFECVQPDPPTFARSTPAARSPSPAEIVCLSKMNNKHNE